MSALPACLIAALLFPGISPRVQRPETVPDHQQSAPVALTNNRPEVSFVISPETVASSPPVVALSFPKVINPSNTAFQVFVYFSYRPSKEARAAPLRILVGNGVLFPPDHPGGFLLRASAAFRKLNQDKATDVRLVLEMKRIHPAVPWSHVEVTVAPPQWRPEPKD